MSLIFLTRRVYFSAGLGFEQTVKGTLGFRNGAGPHLDRLALRSEPATPVFRVVGLEEVEEGITAASTQKGNADMPRRPKLKCRLDHSSPRSSSECNGGLAVNGVAQVAFRERVCDPRMWPASPSICVEIHFVIVLLTVRELDIRTFLLAGSSFLNVFWPA